MPVVETFVLLALEGVKQVLSRPPAQVSCHAESEMSRALYDCEQVPLTPTGPSVRLVVATHAAVGSAPPVTYCPPQWARPSFTGGFPGSAFRLQADGTLRCPADHPLYPQERRPERNGSLRVLYAARIGHCRGCRLRDQCQEHRSSVKPRRVSAVFWPLEAVLLNPSPPRQAPPQAPPLAAVLWKDWPRCGIRRVWLKVMRSETVHLTSGPTAAPVLTEPSVFTRTQRALWRLSWSQRLARNARPPGASPLTVTLHGLPATFAQSFGFHLLPTA